MRVLVVDQDSSLLTTITRTLGEYFTLDAVTTKADCLDLLRANKFDVVVAGERLEDGSGLELLGQLGKHRPNMLRIFAAERERLKLLKGRLGPFRLFRTLSYPIEPRHLLAALSAAGHAPEAGDNAPGSEEPASEPTPTARPKTKGAAAPARQAPALARKIRAAQPPRASGPAIVSSATMGSAAPSRMHAAAARSPFPRSGGAQSSRRPIPSTAPQSGRVGSRMRPAARAGDASSSDASRLAIEARSRSARVSADTAPRRNGFLVGAGVVVMLGGLALAFKRFNAGDASLTSSSGGSVVNMPHFSPEVMKLVADTEAAFQQDDFKHAGTNVRTLQQVAPNHPRLMFFESLLRRRGEARATESAEVSRHEDKQPSRTASTAVPAASSRIPTPQIPAHAPPASAAKASRTIRASVATSTSSDAGASAASSPAALASQPTRFSGRTLEDSNSARPTQPPASTRQAAVTPPPQRAVSHAVTLEPRLIRRVAAEYPLSAADKGTEGLVDLSFAVARDGTVTDVTVVHSEPSDIFNRNAIAAVRRWKYEPKTVNGAPVEAHLQLRLQFKLDHKDR